MEYCNGGDLREYLFNNGRLTGSTVRLFFGQIANGMKALHELKIIHRNLKPSNILLSSCRNNANLNEILIKIADFGYAKFLDKDAFEEKWCDTDAYMVIVKEKK